ncbi:phage portal protein [Actinomyces naeslundii]
MPIEHLTSALEEHAKRGAAYATYRAYYAGQHELQFATLDFQAKYGKLFESLRQNLCPAVVTATTDRLRIRTWGGATEDRLADENGLSRLVAAVNIETARCGDAYTLTWLGRNGQPKARYHRADQIIPHVDPVDPDRLDRAAKIWIEGGYGRANLYYADRVERYRTVSDLGKANLPVDHTAWRPHADDDGGDVIAHSFGVVPCCWFKRGAEEPEQHGTSVLADVIPLQDALNKGLADLLALSEAYARPFWYLLNYQPKSANPLARIQEFTQAAAGLPRGKFDGSRQRIFTHDGPGPFGQLDPPDLGRLLEKQRDLKEQIASIAGVPSYYFSQTSGQIPSGESLRVLSARLVSSVRGIQDVTTPVWRGQAQLLGLGDLTPQWEDPMPLDETEKISNAATLQALGLALDDIVDYLGLPDRDAVLERAAAQRATSAEAAGRALAAGEIPAVY